MKTSLRFLALACLMAACSSTPTPPRGLPPVPTGPCDSDPELPCTTELDHQPAPIKGKEPVGAPPKEQVLALSIQIGLRDEAGLDEFLNSVSDPSSPNFGHFMSRESFAAKHLPTQGQMQKAQLALEARGFTVDPAFVGSTMQVTAPVGVAEATFGTKIVRYREANGHEIRSPNSTLTMPEGLHIIGVHGLASSPVKRPLLQHLRTPRTHDNPQFAWWPYKVQGIRMGYNVPPRVTGAGQTIGMIELDGYVPADVQAYATDNNIAMPLLVNVNVDGYQGQIVNSGAQVEVTLDIEMAMAMAPQVSQIVVYGADQTTSDTAFYDLWNEIANPTQGRGLVKTISCSWGTAENSMSQASITSEHALFKQMAAQGQSIFVAAGDSGAYDDGASVSTDDPASQRWTVAVGGTTLNIGTHGQWLAESTWNGGGGGMSSKWVAPPWQAGVAKPGKNQASASMRNVPDVSLNADPQTGYAVFVNGQYTVVGGTSCAAPLWAGFWAGVQQVRGDHKLPPLGFAAPILWAQGAKGVGYHDIKDGSNNGYYRALQGYDNATGWGTLSGHDMLNALTQP